jgi:hypothetical protein
MPKIDLNKYPFGIWWPPLLALMALLAGGAARRESIAMKAKMAEYQQKRKQQAH